ncbi:tyrosine--tRNA ligase [Yunchengibacter salinarum]|uniref:tyrosine--tRNA ligase n=1 Tax=Yunchengibacter salinarum TaxID=3133399 RepID=UPI0035B647D5
MTAFKSDLLNILLERGFIHQATDLDGLDSLLNTQSVKGYIGFDCTGPSLHVGSLVSIMVLRWMQKCGHQPVVLLGGGTTRIGDPSGKDTQRQMLTDAQIARNKAGIGQVFARFLNFENSTPPALEVDNADWLDGLEYIPFLREVGRHFTINRMLTFDSVKLRLDREQPLTFLEFNYMILQAYDFMKLAERDGVRLQMGGSDQWGNIVNGIELTRRMTGQEVFGLTTPLITTADGGKMGKTASGAIWLNSDMCSDYDYWQFWRNTQDADVGRFLRLFTELPLDEIARLEALEGREINEAKIRLADAATALCRGRDAAEKARKTAVETFEKGGAGEDLPTVHVGAARLLQGAGLLDLFVETGLAKSKGEARRLMKQGGAKLNGTAISDPESCLREDDFKDGAAQLSAGKKRHALVKPA